MPIRKTKSILAGLLCLALAGSLPAAPRPATGDSVVTVDVRLDRSVLHADQSHRAYLMVDLGSAVVEQRERPPLNMAIVLDKSGSMSGAKIAQARRAASMALDYLDARDRLALITYDSAVRTLVPSRPLTDAESFREKIYQIEASGNTALYGGVEAAGRELRRQDFDAFGRIILLSDGLANVGPSSLEDISTLGHRLSREGISVSTIGLGTGYNEDLMTQLAAQAEGNSYFVAEPADLVNIFEAELGDVTRVTARDVQVRIECPAGVRPVRFWGREGEVAGQHAEVRIGQIYGGRNKYALLEVEVDGQQPQTEAELARVSIAYEDLITDQQRQLQATAQVAFSDDADAVEASGDIRVARAIAANRIVEAQREAIRRADEGDVSGATAVMEDAFSANRMLNEQYADDAIATDNERLASQLQEIRAEGGVSNSSRKRIVTEAYQAATQQPIPQQPKQEESTPKNRPANP